MQLSAVDPDLGDNSQVKYFIVGGSDEVFIIEGLFVAVRVKMYFVGNILSSRKLISCILQDAYLKL